MPDSLHSLFFQVYLFANDHHKHNTRFASNGLIKIPTNDASIYGTKLFVTSAIIFATYCSLILLT